MEFRLLGPVEARLDDKPLSLGGPRQRGVLAILLLSANEIVPSDRLIDLIWGESPPETAPTALHGYVSQLRKAIEPSRRAGAPPAVIVTESPGYAIRVQPGQLDLQCFEELVELGRGKLAAGEPQEAAECLDRALALWRGPPLANVRNERFGDDAIRRLDELRMSAQEDSIEAQLASGHHRDTVPELERLIRAAPFRERLRSQLMLALYRSGRQAEALEAFGAARDMLVGELGIEPSESLRAMHQRILRQDPTLLPAQPSAGRAQTHGVAPPDPSPERNPRRRRLLGALGIAALAAGIAAVLVATRGDGDGGAPTARANSLVLIDPRDGSVRASFDVGGTPTSIAVDDEAAWVLNADDQTISRIDARTHSVRTFGSGGVPTDLAAGGQALWVANGKRTRAQFVGPVATSVVRLDAQSTAVRAAVPLPEADGFTSNLHQDHLAVTRDGVWAVNPDATLSLIDPATDKVESVVRGVRAAAVSAGDEGIWALGLDSTLMRVDPASKAPDRRIRVAANSLTALSIGGGAVWAAAPYDGNVWRVDPEPRLVQRTIDVGVGVSDVAYGLGSVWAVNGLRGTVSRIDPRTNRVTATVAIGNTPRQIAVGAGGVWVTVAGSTGEPLPAAKTGSAGALPASTCGRLFYGREGQPERLIVSDMPLRGGSDVPTLQMSEAIAYVLRQRDFLAGDFTVGYQACDDSTAQTGIFDPEKCAANAKLFTSTPQVIGEVGPFNSGCAAVQIPVANQSRGGPLAMISPTNSDVGLTRATPITRKGMLDRLYPSGRRNYVRVYPSEDVQAAAGAILARDLGAVRLAVLSDGGYGETQAFHFARTARRLGLEVVLSRRWRPAADGYADLAAAVAEARPDAVLVSGLLDNNGGRVVRDLRARLPARVELLGNDGLLPISRLFAAAGSAARGMHLSVGGLQVEQLPREGKHFVSQFAATQGGRPVRPEAVYAAQAAEVLLDAIAASDGTRADVTASLRSRRVRRGLIGSFAFDSRGDATSTPITIIRARRGGGASTVTSIEGADVERIIDVPTSLSG